MKLVIDFVRIAPLRTEQTRHLIGAANTILSGPFALKTFESIPRRNSTDCGTSTGVVFGLQISSHQPQHTIGAWQLSGSERAACVDNDFFSEVRCSIRLSSDGNNKRNLLESFESKEERCAWCAADASQGSKVGKASAATIRSLR
jgi:hypothetical protein